MTIDHEKGPPREEILPPEEEEGVARDQTLSQNFLALVSNYTDRPDLLIAEIEKHDPGFIRRMNAASEASAEQLRKARFRFGRFQSYLGACMAALAIVVILAILALAVYRGTNWSVIIALAIFYAVTQGGSSGFAKVIDSIRHVLQGARGGNPKAD